MNLADAISIWRHTIIRTTYVLCSLKNHSNQGLQLTQWHWQKCNRFV